MTHMSPAEVTTITMFAAGNGDAFLIEHSGPNNVAVLIDGGYSSSFHSGILPVLRARHKAQSQLDLVVATHIDADHITGILELLRGNRQATVPAIVQIDRVWHNSLRSLGTIVGEPKSDMAIGDRELLQEIKSRGYPTAKQKVDAQISAPQGSSLADLLVKGCYCWNEGAGVMPIISGTQLDLSPVCSIFVITPSNERLLSLRDWWIREVRRLGYAGPISSDPLIQDAFEFMCSFELAKQTGLTEEISAKANGDSDLADIYEPDSSVTNGSSISFIFKAGTQRLLFLGDTWAEDTIAGLKQISGLQFPCRFDAVKVSHHGSFHNTSPELLQLIDSQHFLISTNGDKHSHPDVAVLRAIVDRPAAFERHLYFNYNTPASNFMKSYTSNSKVPFSVHEDSDIQLILEA